MNDDRQPAGPAAASAGPAQSKIDLGQIIQLGSVLLVLIFLVKVYAVGWYSLTTAAGLIVATPMQVVLGTIAIYAYLAMPMTAVAVAWMVIRPIICPDQTSDRGLLATATWPVLTAVVVVTALLSPVQFLLCGISLLLACLHLELRIQQEGRPLLPERRLVLWGLLALALVAVSLVIIVVPPLNLGKGWRYVGLEHPVPMISWATLVLVAVAMLLAIPFAARTWLGRRLPWFDPTGLARCLRGRTLLLLGSAAVVGYVLFTLETPWRAIQNCIHAGDGDGG